MCDDSCPLWCGAGACTLWDVVRTHPALRILATKLAEVGLVPLLSSSKQPLTLFAPTDDAFRRAAPVSLRELNSQEWQNLLAYHVVPMALREDRSKYPTLFAQHCVRLLQGAVLLDVSKTRARLRPPVLASNGHVFLIPRILEPYACTLKTAGGGATSNLELLRAATARCTSSPPPVVVPAAAPTPMIATVVAPPVPMIATVVTPPVPTVAVVAPPATKAPTRPARPILITAPNILAGVATRPGTLSTLLRNISKSGLSEFMKEKPPAGYTLFAPIDSAWKGPKNEKDKKAVKDYILKHLLYGVVEPTEIPYVGKQANGAPSLAKLMYGTIGDEYFTVNRAKASNGRVYVVFNGNDKLRSYRLVRTGTGIIYELEKDWTPLPAEKKGEGEGEESPPEEPATPPPSPGPAPAPAPAPALAVAPVLGPQLARTSTRGEWRAPAIYDLLKQQGTFPNLLRMLPPNSGLYVALYQPGNIGFTLLAPAADFWRPDSPTDREELADKYLIRGVIDRERVPLAPQQVFYVTYGGKLMPVTKGRDAGGEYLLFNNTAKSYNSFFTGTGVLYHLLGDFTYSNSPSLVSASSALTSQQYTYENKLAADVQSGYFAQPGEKSGRQQFDEYEASVRAQRAASVPVVVPAPRKYLAPRPTSPPSSPTVKRDVPMKQEPLKTELKCEGGSCTRKPVGKLKISTFSPPPSSAPAAPKRSIETGAVKNKDDIRARLEAQFGAGKGQRSAAPKSPVATTESPSAAWKPKRSSSSPPSSPLGSSTFKVEENELPEAPATPPPPPAETAGGGARRGRPRKRRGAMHDQKCYPYA